MRFEGWIRFFMGAMLLVGLFIRNGFWGRYCIDTTLLVGLYIWNRFWGRYCMDTALLVIIHIPRTQKWAGGHRCSLRHNVCRPATTRMRIYTIVKFISDENICTLHF